MRRLLRWSALVVGGLGLLLLLTAAGGWLWLRGSLPSTEGRISLAGPGAEVHLLRDPEGLLTIRAESPEDAAFGLGFAHAQDRLAQMLLMRLVGEGRLSSLAGPRTLPMDRLFRTLRFKQLAAAAIHHIEPETLQRLEAYAAGVNAYLATHRGVYSPETALLDLEVGPWRPQDSLLWGKLMALRLSGNWRQELDLARLATRLSERELADLFPEDAPQAATTLAGLDPPPSLLEALPPGLASDGASNVWALSGRFTASGKPVLANDPHLRLQAPPEWYLARIETPQGTVAGATAPGVPFVLIGHNERIAWGFTTTHSDTQDLVVERLAPGRPDHYETPEGPRPFATWEETIPVRGEPGAKVLLRQTRFGPVISDADPVAEAAAAASGGTVMALAWPALTDSDTSADAIRRLNEARDWQDFTDAMARLVAPQQNVFYADVEGNIGFISPARVPVREGYDGTLPVTGWTRQRLWSGFVPYAELPQVYNPPEGRLINANNRLVGPEYPYLIAKRWPEPYRAQRIAEVLEEQTRHRPEDSEALQLDEVSLAARELLPLLLAFEPAPGTAAEAHRLLSAWDGRMARDRAEPLLFHAWLVALNRRLFADDLGPLYPLVADWDVRRIVHVLREAPRWCGGAVPDCRAALRESLSETLASLGAEAEGAPARLRWGDQHRARLSHPLIGRLPVLGGLLDLELPVGGSDHTVLRATPAFDGPHPFASQHGAGLRAVFDLADLDDSRFIISTGQSGNPLSPYYANLAERWQNGGYVRLTAPDRDKAHHLVLVPEEANRGRKGADKP